MGSSKSHANGNGCSFANGNGKPVMVDDSQQDIHSEHWWTLI